MTAHLFLTLLSQSALLRAVWIMPRTGRKNRALLWLTLAVVFYLPMSIDGLVAISHIMFEASTESSFWITSMVAIGVMTATLLRLRSSAASVLPHRIKILITLAILFGLIGLAIGVPAHGYESGPTPTLAGSQLIFATWLTTSLTAAMIVATLFCRTTPHSFGQIITAPLLAGVLFLCLIVTIKSQFLTHTTFLNWLLF